MSRKSRFGSISTVALAATLAYAAAPSSAIILYRTPARNTAAPTGDLANAGWQFEGQFGAFLGTPIASQYFITAQHIGGGSALIYNNTSYPVDTTYNGGLGYINEPGTDLRIWKIQGTFPTFAPLYNASPTADGPEIGKLMFVSGRGGPRGDPVYSEVVTNQGSNSGSGLPGEIGGPAKPGELKGWTWGGQDGVQSWGTNIVSGVVNGGTSLGELLTFDFDRNGSSEEGFVTVGDSSGGVFIQSNGVWKLAGVNFGVNTGWRYAAPNAALSDTASFDAALFDAGGMYLRSDSNGNYIYIREQPDDVTISAFSSRISANRTWIEGIIGTGVGPISVPEPASALSAITVTWILAAHRRRR